MLSRWLQSMLAVSLAGLVACGYTAAHDGPASALVPRLILSTSFRPGDPYWILTQGGGLYRSSNVGISWERIGKYPTFDEIDFVDRENGWALSEPNDVWASRDNGSSWEKVGIIDLASVRKIRFVSETEGWAIGPFAVYYTHDGGRRWTKQFELGEGLDPSCELLGLTTLGRSTVLALGSGGIACRSDDEGASWQLTKPYGQEPCVFLEAFDRGDDLWLTTAVCRKALHSTDAGRTWVICDFGFDVVITSVCFVDSNEGWAVGFEPSATTSLSEAPGVILHSADGGKTWQKRDVDPTSGGFERVTFLDHDRGLLQSRDAMLATTDGGLHWARVFSKSDMN